MCKRSRVPLAAVIMTSEPSISLVCPCLGHSLHHTQQSIMAGSSSGLYLNGVLAHPSWSGRPSKRARTSRSVWNSTDDWEELVAASTLSTASVSSRPARPRGLQSLATCAEISAWRNFKRLYEEGKVRSQGGEVGRGWWEVEWEYVPDHLKARVRAGVYKRWGGVLKLDVMKDVNLRLLCVTL